MTAPRCTVGECRKPATLRLEIRRSSSDEHPAEVRSLCSDPLCETLARSSAAGFDRRLAPLVMSASETVRANLEALGFPEGPDYEALILAEDEENYGD